MQECITPQVADAFKYYKQQIAEYDRIQKLIQGSITSGLLGFSQLQTELVNVSKEIDHARNSINLNIESSPCTRVFLWSVSQIHGNLTLTNEVVGYDAFGVEYGLDEDRKDSFWARLEIDDLTVIAGNELEYPLYEVSEEGKHKRLILPEDRPFFVQNIEIGKRVGGYRIMPTDKETLLVKMPRYIQKIT